MTIALEFKNVSFKYGQPLFDKISFKVPKEEFLVLIGPNGGGKSTLLKLALGLLKPSEGEIKILGKKVGLKNIGYVPQEVNKVNIMPATVESVIEMGQIGSGKKDPSLLDKTIELMKLEDIRGSQIRNLSLGQRQRVMIARALASDPEMIFLDEPIASIDPESRHTVLDCLKKASNGKTVIIISHDYSIIPSCATAVACVNRSVHYHSGGELTKELFQKANCYCPVELIGHGLPHRVLETHHD